MGARTHVIVPADIEPTVVCSFSNGGEPKWDLLEPEATRPVEGVGKGKETYNPRVEWLNHLSPEDAIYAPLGGVGDAMLVGAADRGIERIFRITSHDLAKYGRRNEVSIPAKYTSGSAKQRDRCDRAALMAELVRNNIRDPWRQYTELDARTGIVRVYISALLASQDEVRKRLQQRTERLERDQDYFISNWNGKGVPPRKSDYVSTLDLRARLIEGAVPVQSLLDYEADLEKEIKRQLRHLPAWTEVLEPVRGCGPRLAARIIGTVIDIQRFPHVQGFWKYAGWAPMDSPKGHKVAPKFTRGQSAQFHQLLRQAMWLFGGQILRNDSQFRWFYDYYKEKHTGLVGQEVNGYEMTKMWLSKRATRFAVQKFVKYTWQAWHEANGRTFAYPASNWLEPEKYWAQVNSA